MRISALTNEICKASITRIVSEFGSGHLKEDQYVFDAITRLPYGVVETKLTISELVSETKCYAEVLVIFDPNPQNDPFRLHLSHALGFHENVAGMRLAPVDLPCLLTSIDCDFCVVSPEGRLLPVASHEDELRENERLMWCPCYQEG